MLLGPGAVVDELDAFHLRYLLARVTYSMLLHVGVQLVPKVPDTAPIIEFQLAAALPVPQARRRGGRLPGGEIERYST